MPDVDAPSNVGPQHDIVQCDVCIVGAGIAGLNALFVASRYLTRDQKVVLVDRRETVGGMWVDAYPYVRLSQPHGMFTVGNIAWNLDQDRSYLATKTDVLVHLRQCLAALAQDVQIDARLGWAVKSYVEADGMVQTVCEGPDGRLLTIEATKLIKAYGHSVMPNGPLELSSSRVLSASPNCVDMWRREEMRASRDPVWIIGGGKTAADTAHMLITECPGREVNLVAGSGTLFVRRDRCFPRGSRRWWGGKPASRLAKGAARRFDGTNEGEVWDWIRANYGTSLTPETGNFMLGLLSESEKRTIQAGLHDVVMEHLVDVVDRGDTTHLVFRSGLNRPVEPGSWIVNCTGYLTRGHEYPYEPYVSRGGSVLSIQPHSATMQFMSSMAYFMTHLLFLDRIGDLQLYEMDLVELHWKAKAAFPCAVLSLAQHNIGLIAESVPAEVFRDCGLDLDRWYPLPRRVLAGARSALTRSRQNEHHRQSLDRLRERFDVRCGPLSYERH